LCIGKRVSGQTCLLFWDRGGIIYLGNLDKIIFLKKKIG
jgi:hypothetical protein